MANNNIKQQTGRIALFYDPTIQGLDSHGRSLNTILAWDDNELERCHNYIQWLFPLPEQSMASFSAPVVDRSTFDAFRSRPELRARLRDSLRRICKFYGFDLQGSNEAEGCRIERLQKQGFEARAENWVTGVDHNHLRITRIIRSLRVLGLETEARAFFKAVEEVHHSTGKISDRSLMFWSRAAERPLYLAPEDKEDYGNGMDFLYEFEEKDLGTKAVPAA